MNETGELAKVDCKDAEIARIRDEYRRRRQTAPGFYAWNRPVNLFFHTQLVRACIATLTKGELFPVAPLRILDVGCGRGQWLLEFCQWGSAPDHLAGIELEASVVEQAARRLPGADIRIGDARNLPWPGESFDIVSQFTVFTSILNDAVKRQVAAEMLRVVKPGGAVLWYDFRYDNPRNRSVRGIEIPEIRTLFPGCRIGMTKVTLAPPVARFAAPISWIAALSLEKIPWMRTHYLGLIRKPAS